VCSWIIEIRKHNPNHSKFLFIFIFHFKKPCPFLATPAGRGKLENSFSLATTLRGGFQNVKLGFGLNTKRKPAHIWRRLRVSNGAGWWLHLSLLGVAGSQIAV